MNITDFGICKLSVVPVRAEASDGSEIVTQLLFGDYVKILEHGKPWIKIYFPADDYEGYMDFKQLQYISEDQYEEQATKSHPVLTEGSIRMNGPLGEQHIFFGSNLPNLEGSSITLGDENYEILDELQLFNETLVETSLRYLNTPYLWGGKGIFGIDCSGFSQIVAKAHGKKLPRNASQQVHVGELIDFNNREAGDLIYFINKKGIVHHVGFLTDKDHVIHASGHVRIDPVDEKGIFRKDFQEYTHTFHSIRRI